MSDLVSKLKAAVGEQCTIRMDYPAEADLILEAALQLDASQREIERAMQLLVTYGIPRDYGKNPARGIGILAQRFNKESHALNGTIGLLETRLHSSLDLLWQASQALPGHCAEFAERIERFVDDNRTSAVDRPCTCHPDDNPPRPCPRKYALEECRAATAPDRRCPPHQWIDWQDGVDGPIETKCYVCGAVQETAPDSLCPKCGGPAYEDPEEGLVCENQCKQPDAFAVVSERQER